MCHVFKTNDDVPRGDEVAFLNQDVGNDTAFEVLHRFPVAFDDNLTGRDNGAVDWRQHRPEREATEHCGDNEDTEADINLSARGRLVGLRQWRKC